jgi:hypothetical protein
MITLKWILKDQRMIFWVGFIWLRIEMSTGSNEGDNEQSESIKG